MEDIPVTVNILDRNYKMRVKPEDQSYLMAAAESINAQVAAYKKNYSYNDYQDLLAMVAITKTTQLNRLQHQSDTEQSSIREKLESIEQILVSNDNRGEAQSTVN